MRPVPCFALAHVAPPLSRATYEPRTNTLARTLATKASHSVESACLRMTWRHGTDPLVALRPPRSIRRAKKRSQPTFSRRNEAHRDDSAFLSPPVARLRPRRRQPARRHQHSAGDAMADRHPGYNSFTTMHQTHILSNEEIHQDPLLSYVRVSIQWVGESASPAPTAGYCSHVISETMHRARIPVRHTGAREKLRTMRAII